MPYKPEKGLNITIDVSDKKSLENGLKELEIRKAWLGWFDFFVEGVKMETIDKLNPEIKKDFLRILNMLENEGMWQSWSDAVSKGIRLEVIDPSDEEIKKGLMNGINELRAKKFNKALSQLIAKGVKLSIIGKEEFPEYQQDGIDDFLDIMKK